jgi:hypothetical protein
MTYRIMAPKYILSGGSYSARSGIVMAEKRHSSHLLSRSSKQLLFAVQTSDEFQRILFHRHHVGFLIGKIRVIAT